MTCKLVFIFALIVIPSLAFFGLFGSYTAFDDEGYSIGVIRNVAEGIPLYTQQFDFHGPLPFLVKAVIFRGLGIPITQESVRVWVWGIWLLSCSCLSLAIWMLTRSALLSACAIVVTGAHLFALRFNPGHPEDFVVLFLSLAILIAALDTAWLSDNLRIAMLGSIAGVLAATKINVGIFYLFALGLWILASIHRTKAWRIVAVLFTIAATAMPAALMRSFLWPSWQLLVVSTFSILITCAAFLRLPVPSRFRWKHVGLAVGSTAATIAAILVVAQLCGSRVQDVLNQTVLVAATHSSMIVRSAFSWRAAVAIPVFALVGLSQWKIIWSPASGPPQTSPTMLKVALPLLALSCATLLRFQFYMPLIGAVCWLVAFPDCRTVIGGRSQSPRIFIASIAVFQMLQVFPIRGAQTSWSTLALSVCGMLLLYDGMSELSFFPPVISRFAYGSVKVVAAVLFSLLAILTATLSASYFQTPSLGFQGANLVRVPMAMKADFDWVTASVGHYCDALVTQPGLDSLVLWSSKPGSELMRRSPMLLVDWPITMPSDRQQQAARRLDGAARVCGVYSKRLSDWWTKRLPQDAHAKLAQLPLVSYIQQLSPIRTVGDYEIRGNAAVRESWKDDYLLDGERDLDGNRSAVGVPTSLLRAAIDSELTFGFEVGSTGPLLSAQKTRTDSDDEPFATEPLVYISRDGTLMIRASAGVFVPSRARVADAQWHELSLRRRQNGWAISVDGAELGLIADFMTADKGPRYLQVGPAYVENCAELGKGWKSFRGKVRDVRARRVESEYALSAGTVK
jgi:hypothetical protein